MYRATSQRRFKKGERVLALKGYYFKFGLGTIKKIGIHLHRAEIPLLPFEEGDCEIVEDRIPSALVAFDCDQKARILPLALLISYDQLQTYESLHPGDFITFGHKEPKQAVVISNEPKRETKNSIPRVKRSVYILVDGIKRKLRIEQKILSVQRAKDYLDFE